jgi:folate-binding protein YgfZ
MRAQEEDAIMDRSALLTPHASSYDAALSGVVFLEEPERGRIFMRGRDRAALLHRLSTNDIARLRPGEGTRTVLTTPIGRIIDLLHVYALDDALLLITSPGQGPLVFGHLRKNIFFNDQVTLEPAGRSHGQFALYGPEAAAALAALAQPSAVGLAPWGIIAGAEGALVMRREPIGGAGYTLLVPAARLAATRVMLAAQAVQLSPEDFEALRVEQGYGAFGRELSQEYIPLEAGLRDAISFTKGCYVGQEIIARMDSRGRLAKRLMGLRLRPDDGRPAGGEAQEAFVRLLAGLALPAHLEAGSKEAGDLTSAVVSPRFGPIGLGYVRVASATPGTVLRVAGADMSAEVVELPFVREMA